MDGGAIQQTIMPAHNIKKLAYIEVKPKTDSFIKIVSDIHWGWLLGGAICFLIGLTVVIILLAKLTPIGKMVTKAWNGLRAMFDALIKWKPKGSK